MILFKRKRFSGDWDNPDDEESTGPRKFIEDIKLHKDRPKLVKSTTVCALCKSPINRHGFCSNRKCKYGN